LTFGVRRTYTTTLGNLLSNIRRCKASQTSTVSERSEAIRAAHAGLRIPNDALYFKKRGLRGAPAHRAGAQSGEC
jgi:hypothetical protein